MIAPFKMMATKLSRLSSKYSWAAAFPECVLDDQFALQHKVMENELTGRQYLKRRAELAEDLYRKYNQLVFDNLLPEDIAITWNKRMLKKAGRAVLTSNTGLGEKSACIELSEKMLTDIGRLKNTLLHEMCHVATRLLDDFERDHHGPMFKKWAAVVHRRVPEITITTYHTYEAHKPFIYQCTGEKCKTKFKRHSKKGIDVTKHICGVCKGDLEYIGKFDMDGTMKKERAVTAYNSFVKENYSTIKKLHSKLGNAGVLKKLAELYKESQTAPGL